MAPVPKGTVFDANSRTQPPPAPYINLQQAYCASKVRALNEAERWVSEKKPHWGVVAVMPGWVIGRDWSKSDVAGVKSGTNMQMLSLCLGAKNEGKKAGCAVHVDDVARICVGAAFEEEKKVGCEERGVLRGFMAGRPIEWMGAVEVVRNEFGREVERGVLSTEGVQGTMEMPVDGSETERVFGFEFLPWEEMVRSVVGHYVEVSKKDKTE